ncbi:hypothetical protein [Vibrio sp. ER1A]|uniref:hypothetical protein n=1 Tax=Vibrio sp. ER1A TaxID=1517681 RepID=UPI0004DD5CD0|nr:hypothetical protein [Vibrio sp. ER1A]KFA99226.1 hypothetical protein HW45_05100 [Vibrio sp. ER1A]
MKLILSQSMIETYIKSTPNYEFKGFTSLDNVYDELRLNNIKLLIQEYGVKNSNDIKSVRDMYMSNYADDVSLEYLITKLFDMVLHDLPYYNDYIVWLSYDKQYIEEYKIEMNVPLDTKHEVLMLY